MVKTNELTEGWKKLIVGQNHAIEKIVPYIIRGMAGFTLPSRPMGVFFLMGPSGVGKTRTTETLAELLHKNEKNMIRIDCGEFQMDHEIAKLIGAPPGYLGHRETLPILTQTKLKAVCSDDYPYPIILFDEIEKASSALWRILLGVLDKGSLRLGDNSTVDFQKTIIFLSSNIGAKEMASINTGLGFHTKEDKITMASMDNKHFKQMEKIGMTAMARKFPPEFHNRVDEFISYHPLNEETLRQITVLELDKLQNQVIDRLGSRTFRVVYDTPSVDYITSKGTSLKYGARELKRTINRLLLNPLADDFVNDKIPPGSDVFIRVDQTGLTWYVEPSNYVTFHEEVVSETPLPLPIKRTRKRT